MGSPALNGSMNLIFMGGFSYPHGMAGTKRIQNIIDALKMYPDVRTRVVLQRQSGEESTLSGVHRGVPYETVMGNTVRAKMLVLLPILYFRTISILRRAFQPREQNIIYHYGPLFVDSIVPLFFAKKCGYKIVFDINEDYTLMKGTYQSYYELLRVNVASWFMPSTKLLASGIIAISCYLEEKWKSYSQDKVPVHYMPISVDLNQYPEKPTHIHGATVLFYAGSFGNKDGVDILLDAFDMLAARNKDVRLVLTGKGNRDAINKFVRRWRSSPYADRIEYKGYLDELSYYKLLNDIDIPCMTRVDLAFAHAGFPFKLGEFLASGKPVVASRVSDVPKFFSDKINAMLVQPGSSSDVCEAVEFLINNPDKAAEIGNRGREEAKALFDYKEQGRSLRAFLQRL